MQRKNIKIKNNSKSVKSSRQRKVAPKPRYTPFGDVGSTLGGALGSVFGPEAGLIGNSVGRFLGTGIGSVFGSGDYKITGPRPNYNALNGQVPRFSTTRQTNIVAHREYLGEVLGTTNFTNTVYPIQPGIPNTFPWLSSVAGNYQEYRIHGMLFEFKSEITDFVTGGQPGYLVMATNYDAVTPSYSTKQQMENSEYAVSTKPTNNQIHMIECSAAQNVNVEQYVRSGAVPAGTDPRLYDLGNFQIATGGNPAGATLGELWVTYVIEFFKPIIDNTPAVQSAYHSARSTISNANPLGTVQTRFSGALTGGVTGTTISWNPPIAGQTYLIVVNWWGTVGAAPVTAPGVSLTNCTPFYMWNTNLSYADFSTSGGTVGGLNCSFTFTVTASQTPGLSSTLTFSGGGQLNGMGLCDIIVTPLGEDVTG